MYQLKIKLLVLLYIGFCTLSAKGQYTLNGAATKDDCNCYTLTKAESMKSGSVINNQQIELTTPFDFSFNVFLGCKDVDGADGMAFVLLTEKNVVGRRGSGMGVNNVSPSLAIALDTYQNIDTTVVDDNLNDPPYDHMSVHVNGVVIHGDDIVPPVRASDTSDNIEDCQWHLLRIQWEPVSQKLRAYFDGSLRLEVKIDLVKDVFQNRSSVYWGFSGATGSRNNIQKFCTALNAGFTTSLPADGTCVGNAIDFKDQSVSFLPITRYYWDLGDGTISTNASVPAHLYAQPGQYTVKLAVTGQDGCNSDTVSKVITIASKPHADFKVFDTCFGKTPRVAFTSPNIGTSARWSVNGSVLSSSDQLPVLEDLAPGQYLLKTHMVSDYGCGTDEATASFTIKDVPVVAATVSDLCVNNSTVPFRASQKDSKTHIQQWNWQLGDGKSTNLQNPIPAYSSAGTYTTRLWAVADNGCASDTVSHTIRVAQAYAHAGNDTTVQSNLPFQLKGSGEGLVRWSPEDGLNRSDILTPTATLTMDKSYELQVATAEGCVAKDTVTIKVLKSAPVYVPNAFTPNGNGKNDLFKPYYNDIKKLDYFAIYNRWGEIVFQTSDTGKGWDGRFKGQEMGAAAYVWVIKATDTSGHTLFLKGTVTLIR